MNFAKAVAPINLLLVEDNAADAFLIDTFFRDSNILNTLHQVRDGEAAMEFLRQENQYSQAPRPHLIFLDLNLPKKDGREVLADLKSDPALKEIPVIVMTGSAAAQDISQSYQLHASCYVTKPSDLNQFNQTMQSIEDFWLNYVKLPVPLTTS